MIDPCMRGETTERAWVETRVYLLFIDLVLGRLHEEKDVLIILLVWFSSLTIGHQSLWGKSVHVALELKGYAGRLTWLESRRTLSVVS